MPTDGDAKEYAEPYDPHKDIFHRHDDDSGKMVIFCRRCGEDILEIWEEFNKVVSKSYLETGVKKFRAHFEEKHPEALEEAEEDDDEEEEDDD